MGLVEVPVGDLAPQTVRNITLIYHVYGEVGATVSLTAAVSSSTPDPQPLNNNTFLTLKIVQPAAVNDLQQRLNRLGQLLARPLPAFYGNSLQTLLQQALITNEYDREYLQAYQLHQLALFYYTNAGRLFRQGLYAAAARHADWAFDRMQEAERHFSNAIDIFNRRVAHAIEVATLVQNQSYAVMCATLKTMAGPGAGLACEILAGGLEYAIDRFFVKGGEEANKELFRKVLVKAVLDWGAFHAPPELADATVRSNPVLQLFLLRVVRDQKFIELANNILASELGVPFERFLEFLQESAEAIPAVPVEQTGGPSSALRKPDGVMRSLDTQATEASSPGGWPVIYDTGVVNAASYLGTGISAHQIVAIFGKNLGPGTPSSLQLDSSGRVASTLDGVRVLFDGVPAPLLYVSEWQINGVVPTAVGGRKWSQVQVEYGGFRSLPVLVPALTSAPSVFTLEMTGMGQAAVVNQDGSVNSHSTPAETGSIISIYLTGAGLFDFSMVDGEIPSGASDEGFLPIRVFIGGLEAEVTYAGVAPTLVRGVTQVNARVPTGLATGAPADLVVMSGESPSQPGVYLWVK
jgi:uncharacterized protein (TIGR03437 family)